MENVDESVLYAIGLGVRDSVLATPPESLT